MEEKNRAYSPGHSDDTSINSDADRKTQPVNKHRRRSSTSVEGITEQRPHKRQLHESTGTQIDEPRFKRQKRPLNLAYLDILNHDIEEAALSVSLDDHIELDPSQVGLTYWSALEKKQLYEAVSRVGISNLDAIVARVDTKSVLEVQHYLQFLQKALQARQTQAAGSNMKLLALAELPAAVELSNECCQAQEEAADSISLKQERHEQIRESTRWGSYWDITPSIAAALDRRTAGSGLPEFSFMPLFRLSDWLALSRRVFMNSAVPEGNWVNIDSNPPSIWTTCLEDFHSLALSLTRRIMQTALYIASSRIRTQAPGMSDLQMTVRARDIHAAVASLGLTQDSSKFWATAARRLRLNVHDSPAGDAADGPIDPEILSYDAVEAHLFSHGAPKRADSNTPTTSLPHTKTEAPQPSLVEETSGKDDAEEQSDESSSSEVEDGKYGPFVEAEVKEGLQYSVTTIRDIVRFREALTTRVLAEREAEDVAEHVDSRASAQAEAHMWKTLEKTPSHPLPKLKKTIHIPRSGIRVADMNASEQGWAEATEYYAPWETLQHYNDFSDSSDDVQDEVEDDDGEDDIDVLTNTDAVDSSDAGDDPP